MELERGPLFIDTASRGSTLSLKFSVLSLKFSVLSLDRQRSAEKVCLQKRWVEKVGLQQIAGRKSLLTTNDRLKKSAYNKRWVRREQHRGAWYELGGIPHPRKSINSGDSHHIFYHSSAGTMERTCPNCGNAFAHASGLSRHKKFCGTSAPRHPCPYCATTFTQYGNLQRHMTHRCKGKRPAEEELPERPPEKVRLVDYESSDEEEPGPSHHWRATVEPPSDTESEESEDEEPQKTLGEWYTADEESWELEETANTEEEPWEQEDTSQHTEEPLNLEALKEALPWAQYQGISQEQYSTAQEQTGGNPLFEFQFLPVSRNHWMKRVQKTIYNTKFRQRRDPEDTDDIGVAIVTALEEATRQHLERIGAQDEDRVFLAMTPQGFEHTYQTVTFTVQEFREGSTRLEELLRKLAGKLNSNQSFHPDQGFQLDLTLVRPMGTGSGRVKELSPGRIGYVMSRKLKQSIIPIINSDELCCARAIVTLKARAELEIVKKKVKVEEGRLIPDQTHLQVLKAKVEELQAEYKTLSNTKLEKRKTTLQRLLAHRLHQLADVPKGPCGMEEIKAFQAYLYTLDPPFQIKVFCDQTAKPLYTGPQKVSKDRILYLLKSQNHFDCITTLSGFFNRSYWCDDCDRAFNTDDPAHHSCQGRHCFACGCNPCPDRFEKPHLPCEQCHGLFFGPTCFREHKSNGRCEALHTCTTCFARFETDKEHTCWHAKCPNCKEEDDLREHMCFIQPVEEEEEGGKPPLFVYADIEAMVLPDQSFQPNLICYQTSKPNSTIQTLKGPICCREFVKELGKLALVFVGKKKKRERPVTVLFHNLKGFDGVFILKELYKDSRKVINQACMGAKVLTFKTGSITFKDSLCFLPFPLATFPSTFDIKEIKKGYFPHAFNTPENQGYVGSIPDKSFYDPEGMKPKDKAAFDAWYAEQVARGERFDLQKELVEYCHSDVALLKKGCEAFVKQFRQEADFNPFEKCSTIASACNLYWRRSIEEGTDAAQIAVRPLQGWHGAQVNQSHAALEWLAYQESHLAKDGKKERIRHARNGGEKRVKTSKGKEHVDGWDEESKTVFEFLGCLWHGCPSCYPNSRDLTHPIMPDRTPNQAHRATTEKLKRLGEKYTVKSVWECTWRSMKQQNPSVKSFVSGLSWVDPLQPRDAFFGGRTGAVALHHEVSPGEKIFYVDVTSLYPWVNKNAEYPLGHPEIIFNPSLEDFEDYFGLAKVSILPPYKLFHPVLPVRIGEKLTFPLCSACVKEELAKPLLEREAICRHSREERVLVGTWCTPEIEKAREVGYVLLEVHEMWNFERGEGGLFAEYVDTWLKVKTEASGWPRDCDTEEEKQDFIERFEEREGIRLDYKKVEPNPGLKATAKLMLNSFWGKFGQRENLPQTAQCTSPDQLYKLLDDDCIEVQNIRFSTEDVLEVVYAYKEDSILPNNRTNVFIAAFTTCWARLKLYSYLQTLGEQVLYYDTDSVIYKWSAGLPKVPTGDYLGDLKDELNGDYIVEFLSGGPKNYAYRTAEKEKVEWKVRGFTLNVRGQETINFNTMRKNILAVLNGEKEVEIVQTNPTHFKRDVVHKGISVGPQRKRYRLVFDKRVVIRSTKSSLPFGFFQED